MTAAQAHALALLLAVLPARRPYAACLTARTERVIADADALLLAVGYAESHLGCARGSGGCWGAPVSRTARHTAGRASHAASALALGHFRCGRCVCAGSYVARVGGLWSRVERRAEVSR